MLKSLLPDEVKVNITIDDIRIKSNLTTAKTIRLTKKSFFNTMLGFTQSYSGVLGEIESFVQIIPGTSKSEKPNNNSAIDMIPLKCDCIIGSIVNCVGEPIL